MEINAYHPKPTSAPVFLKTINTEQPADPSAQSAQDSTGKAEVQSAATGISAIAQAKKSDDSENDLQQAVSKLNEFVQTIQRNLQFTVDKESGTLVVKVIDSKSEKVIRQIPTEETLRLARTLMEQKDELAFNIFSSKA
ncbi:Flagellar protein FlaG [Candidatus Methylobacter favarea]|uniref:Flagellar protein FlaG n=1 Tax=Candidatus Methylobacter favarea TaxID=2707345 RepID=A0A8S0XI63_9GAMM|nr:flagellar protein FlaG [Candidatus Methylobacter favarea]CAA9892323.1 Flagellar protein FlaG [Candidatus Methylobacter favarea]